MEIYLVMLAIMLVMGAGYLLSRRSEKAAAARVPEQLALARQLIQSGRLQAAHKVLNQIDHPTARRWKISLSRREAERPDMTDLMQEDAGAKIVLGGITSRDYWLYRFIRRR
jgi:hypothetical protein